MSTRSSGTSLLSFGPTCQAWARGKSKGPAGRWDDGNTYRVWQKTDTVGSRGRYLVDAQGVPQYIVDPAINGQNRFRPNGQKVEKFDAPKATLMSYIIKGILNQQLPGTGPHWSDDRDCARDGWDSVIGICRRSYLPLSASSPIFIGGLVRWLVDRNSRRKNAHMTEEELVAESDKSPGVLMASGYAAGAALAGIVFAFMAGYFTDALEATKAFMLANNPFFDDRRTR